MLADPAAGAEQRAEASAVLASLAPDRGVLGAGIAAVVVAVALAVWAVVHG